MLVHGNCPDCGKEMNCDEVLQALDMFWTLTDGIACMCCYWAHTDARFRAENRLKARSGPISNLHILPCRDCGGIWKKTPDPNAPANPHTPYTTFMAVFYGKHEGQNIGSGRPLERTQAFNRPVPLYTVDPSRATWANSTEYVVFAKVKVKREMRYKMHVLAAEDVCACVNCGGRAAA